jgi:hypothetical protein
MAVREHIDMGTNLAGAGASFRTAVTAPGERTRIADANYFAASDARCSAAVSAASTVFKASGCGIEMML